MSAAEMMKKFEDREKEWASQRVQLIEKNKALETRLNQLERRERQNKAIVRGMPNTNKANALSELNQLFGKLNEPVMVESAVVIREQSENRSALILATFKSQTDKSAVFKQRQQLSIGSTKIFIDDDLTRREQEIRFHQRQFRKELNAREPNAELKFRGDRICVNGEWRTFDESTKTFKPEN